MLFSFSSNDRKKAMRTNNANLTRRQYGYRCYTAKRCNIPQGSNEETVTRFPLDSEADQGSEEGDVQV